jgi:Cu+-exporting ATPase
MVFNVVTAVLIIACPCALALSAPFAIGNILRIFGYQKFYLKNAETVENLAKIDTIIFDKTGTITSTDKSHLIYRGEAINAAEISAVKKVLRASNHPLSRSLYEYLQVETLTDKPTFFEEKLGKGITAIINNVPIKLGSASFVGATSYEANETAIHLAIDNQFRGSYIFKNSYREGTKDVFEALSKKYKLVILSGDNDGEKAYLEKFLPKNTLFQFNQKPENKLEFIKELQQNGEKVMMVGDGLNDAGALAQSNVGIVISENVNVFSPACDGILDAQFFNNLPKLLTISNKTITIIKTSFILAFCYNVIGMYFALTGALTPIVAAILMPVSSISIVVFVTIMTNLISKKYLK